MDKDLRSIQEARDLVTKSHKAFKKFKHFTQQQVDKICLAMVTAGAAEAVRLGQFAHDETGFGKPDSKTKKNIFATTTLYEEIRDMKTCGIVEKCNTKKMWRVASPMGVIGSLVPSTNPTSTAMYKAIISAKARCGIVMSPHPSAAKCTADALNVVAQAAYAAGAPEGLFGCMTQVSLEGTNALLEHPLVDLILATGGTPMVKAAYSKGKPAYGVGAGNVPAYVDRSANIAKAGADIVSGPAFDWGTLCSTERSVVADTPIKAKLIESMKHAGAYFVTEAEKPLLRKALFPTPGRLNVNTVGKSPAHIAKIAGFKVPAGTNVLVAEVDVVGNDEPLSKETLSPILSFYTVDGWQQGCDRCLEILHFGGIGHTLALHADNERVIEAFAIEKPAMRIVVNTVSALGSVGLTTGLFPAFTLGPGTIGGSITSDNISPMHLLNIKRIAFEVMPINTPAGESIEKPKKQPTQGTFQKTTENAASKHSGDGSWIDEIEAQIRGRAGNPVVNKPAVNSSPQQAIQQPLPSNDPKRSNLPEDKIERLINRFKK